MKTFTISGSIICNMCFQSYFSLHWNRKVNNTSSGLGKHKVQHWFDFRRVEQECWQSASAENTVYVSFAINHTQASNKDVILVGWIIVQKIKMLNLLNIGNGVYIWLPTRMSHGWGSGGGGGGRGGATKMSHGMLQREILKLINIYAVQGGKYMTVNILLKFHGTKEFYL